jgi:hypothetical protein
MDGHKDALTDEALAHEIESALSVDPSPQFVARVRERLARQPLAATGVVSWRLWLGASVVVAGALALFVSLAGGPRETSPRDSTRPEAKSAPRLEAATPRVEPAEPVVQPDRVVASPVRQPAKQAVVRNEPREESTTEVALPPVLIPENEKRGFELLVMELSDTKQAEAVAKATRGLITPGPPWLEIEPVIIEPLRDVGISQGEGQ